MKCVSIGGEPATGKTTLMRELMKKLEKPQNFRFGLCQGHFTEVNNLAVMGIYDGQGTFEGTDRLSMAVNGDFQAYVQMRKRNIMFEGDRLFNGKNLHFIDSHYDQRIIVLQQSNETLHQRHIDRGDTQTEKFLKGRKTKIANILSDDRLEIETYQLNEINDTISLSDDIWSWLNADTD